MSVATFRGLLSRSEDCEADQIPKILPLSKDSRLRVEWERGFPTSRKSSCSFVTAGAGCEKKNPSTKAVANAKVVSLCPSYKYLGLSQPPATRSAFVAQILQLWVCCVPAEIFASDPKSKVLLAGHLSTYVEHAGG